jgi:hypothetical protein
LTPLRSATVLSFVFAAFSSFGPCDQRPVTAHFVVLDGLRIRDDGGIQHRLVLNLAGGLVGLLDDAVDGRTLSSACSPFPAGFFVS